MTATTTPVIATMPRPAVIARLLAGRGTFRLAVQLMIVALVAVWSQADFSHFANALGMWMWLPITTSAPEKAALKLLPRTRMLAPTLARMTIGISAMPAVVLITALIPFAVFASGSTAVTYLAAGAWAAATGLLMTVVGLHRLRGRSSMDAGAFLAATTVVAVVTAITWFAGMSAQFQLLGMVAGIVAVNGWALAALPREWLFGERRGGHKLLGKLLRTTALLGVTDVAGALGPSSIFLMLAATGQVSDSGPLYFAVAGSGIVCTIMVYLLRLGQPATSARLRGTGGNAGRVRALRLLRRGQRCAIAFAVLFAVLVAVPGTRELLAGEGLTFASLLGVLSALAVFEVAMFVMVTYAGYLLENTDNKVLVLTSSSALAGVIAATVLTIVLVPALGAAGGMAAMAIALGVQAHTARRMLLHTRPELTRP